MRHLLKHYHKIKLVKQQYLYTKDQTCSLIYIIVEGEFEIVKEWFYDKSQLPQNLKYKEVTQTEYQLFQKALHLERKKIQHLEEPQPKQKLKRRSKTVDDVNEGIQIISDRRLIQSIGQTNYRLIQQLYHHRETSKNEHQANQHKDELKIKPKAQKPSLFTIANIGIGQILGEEAFSYELNGGEYMYSCRCISSSAKVISVKRSDVYKLCAVFDWFGQMFYGRCQRKKEWLQETFREKLQWSLKEQLSIVDPKELQHKKTQMQDEQKDEDQRVLRKYSEISKTLKDRDQILNTVHNRELVQKKFQKNSSKEVLNVINLDADVDVKKYEQSLRNLLAKKGLKRNQSNKTIVTESPSPRKKQQNSSLDNSSFLRGLSPIHDKNDYNITINHDNTVKHQAAIKLREQMEKSVNPLLNNPIKAFKSGLMKENCVVYEGQHKYQQQSQDYDIGLVDYLVRQDKTQLRLQDYVIRKNIRLQKQLKSQPQIHQQPQQYQPDFDKPVSKPAQFCQFQTLLNHVTKQHYNKMLDAHKEKGELEQLPVSVRQLLTYHPKEMGTQTSQTMYQVPTVSKQTDLTRLSQTGRFSQGAINRVKIRKQSRQQPSVMISTTRLEAKLFSLNNTRPHSRSHISMKTLQKVNEVSDNQYTGNIIKYRFVNTSQNQLEQKLQNYLL